MGRPYRCGGYASRSGHCGGTDCESCYPGGAIGRSRRHRGPDLEPPDEMPDEPCGLCGREHPWPAPCATEVADAPR